MAAGSDLSLCGSAHTKVGLEKGSFLWVLESFSQLGSELLESPVFSAVGGKFSWKLQLYPIGLSEDDGSYVSLYLTKVDSSNHILPLLRHTCKMRLVNSEDEVAASRSWNIIDYNNSYGYKQFIKREVLFNKLADDVLKIYVDFTATISVRTISLLQCPAVKLSSTTTSLYETRKFSDFVIRVQETDLHVHKSILALKSPVFEAMLLNDTNESQTGLLKLQDIELTTACAMVEFLYVGGVSNLDVTLALDLLRAADKYNIVDLLQYCSRYLQEHLCCSNVIDILVVASDSNASKLKKVCFMYINANRSFKPEDEQKEKLKQRSDLLLEMYSFQFR